MAGSFRAPVYYRDGVYIASGGQLVIAMPPEFTELGETEEEIEGAQLLTRNPATHTHLLISHTHRHMFRLTLHLLSFHFPSLPIPF